MTEIATIGAALGAGALARDAMDKSEEDIYDVLCRIRDDIRAIKEYNERQREQTPYIAELYSSFVGSAIQPGKIIFTPASSFSIKHIYIFSQNNADMTLKMGTRGPIIFVGLQQRLDLPYHLNGGQDMSLELGPATTDAVFRALVVGYYEHNRVGPQKVIGTD